MLYLSSSMSMITLIIAFVFLPRMQEYLGDISLAETMGKIYGKEVSLITAIAGAIGASGLIAVQFKAFGNIFSYFTSVPSYYAIIILGCVVVLYSALGGIKAVTTTDMFQFITFGIILPQ